MVLELAEPRVRAGVWEHTSFRTDPLRRLRRTGLAAMVTVYGPRSAAERMIAGVVRAHAAIAGRTSAGLHYRADDAELLSWVQATAFYGFAQAYSRYVRPLTLEEFDRFYAEGAPASHLYGTFDAPVFPGPLRPVQRLLVRAAVDLVPDWARRRLELAPDQGLRSWERPLVRSMGALADRLMLRDGPAVQSCPRLGLPAHHLYRG